jgi:hypothetical protein
LCAAASTSETVSVTVPKGYYAFNIPVVPTDAAFTVLFPDGSADADHLDRIIAGNGDARYLGTLPNGAVLNIWSGSLKTQDVPSHGRIFSYREDSGRTFTFSGSYPSSVTYDIPVGYSGFGITGTEKIALEDFLTDAGWETNDRIICGSQGGDAKYIGTLPNGAVLNIWSGTLKTYGGIEATAGCTFYKQTAGEWTHNF